MFSPILNPETPLAFLPPTLASQFEVSRYLMTATCGMFSWDVLLNLRNDYKLLRRYNLRIPTLVYFVSRVSTFAYIITSTAFTIGPVGNCQVLQIVVGSCYAVAVPVTCLLFFFRVKAIFMDKRVVVASFAFLWLCTLGGSIIVPFAISGTHIGPTDHCINTGVKSYSSVPLVVATINDTLVFIAISWRLLYTFSPDETVRGHLRSFFSGENLPAFSKSLLQQGQEYYLVSVGGNILAMAMILAPNSLPAVFHAMFTVPAIAITNCMACRVYRDTKFGRISSSQPTLRIVSGQGSLPRLSPSFSCKIASHTLRADLEASTSDISASDGIQITTTVHEASERFADVSLSTNRNADSVGREK